MPFTVLSPPATDDKVQEVGKRIIELAYKLERPIDVEGFLMAWIRGTRVIIETDNDGKDVGIAFVAMGDRWLYMDRGVTVLFYKMQNEAGFIDFMKSMGAAIGARALILEAGPPEKLDGEERSVVREIYL